MTDAGVRVDPYPFYGQLRELGPTYSPEMRAWLVGRYADVSEALRHPELSVMRAMPGLRAIDVTDSRDRRPYSRVEELALTNRDPPDHTRVRRLVNRAFTNSAVTRQRERVSNIADRLVGARAPAGEMEVLKDFAFPFPLEVIRQLIGIPDADNDRLRGWGEELSKRMGIHPRRPPAARRAGNQAITEMVEYFAGLVRLKRADPGDDLVTRLIEAADDEDQLTEEEVIANAIFLVFAGHETTANLIGNGLLALFCHPVMLERVAGDRSLIPGLVEELIRYETSVQMIFRSARADVEIGGVVIPRGARILLILAAANRDAARFADPDDLVPAREDNQHLGFGWGIHYCLGAALARQEVDVALNAILDHCPGIRLDADSVEWQDRFQFRGLKALPVRWDPP